MVKKESHSSDHLTEGTRRKMMSTKLGTALAAFFLLASVAVIIAIATVQVKKRAFISRGLKYGIVLDAGSSRTTVYVYQWPAEKENNTGIVTQTAKCTVKGPGISDMNDQAWKNLKECIKSLTNVIPSNRHNSTPIFLGATAGMRLLHQKDEQMSNAILSKLQDYLRSLPFEFHNASIISGQEEGLYGWITVNYLMGNFLEKNIWNAWVHPHGAKTVGSLDLGGASTQIAFVAPDDAEGTDLIKVSLYGYEYNVYTHSYLCYGKNEAEKRILADLVTSSSTLPRVYNPCYPNGFKTVMPLKEIFDSECTKHLATSVLNLQNNVTFHGTSDQINCKALVQKLFDLQSCQGKENCSFNGVYQPSLSGDFMAYAGFYHSYAALKINGSNSWKSFTRTMTSLCSQNWTDLIKQGFEEKYLKSYCFSANYVHTLLANGYKFNEGNWEQLDFQKEVNKTSIAWSLGYMLAQSNMIPAEAKLLSLPMSSSLFAGLLILFSALIILTLVFLMITLVRICY